MFGTDIALERKTRMCLTAGVGAAEVGRVGEEEGEKGLGLPLRC